MAEPERSNLWCIFVSLFGCLRRLFCIEREEPTRSKDPTYVASSSSTPPHEGDYKDGDEWRRGNDNEDLNFKASSSSNPGGDYESRDEQQKRNINKDLNSKASSSSNPGGDYESIDEQQKGNVNKDLNCKASSSLTPPHEGDYEGGDEQTKGNDIKDLNSKASSSSTPPHEGDYEGRHKQQRGNNYEVFLSFHGEDTRKGFTSHLYRRLVNAGIQVFIDKINIPIGEAFDQALLNTIEQSKISIPIISENYESSTWCLRELAHMLKCKRIEGQTVLPIFYKVKPSKVRNLGNEWRDAIIAGNKNLCERDLIEWKKALEEVSHLEALESEEIDNGQEGTLVEMVFKKVMRKLRRLFLLNVPKQLVGINGHVKRITRMIDAKFNSTRIIGIYGMGGIGKTTLAKVLYNKLSCDFEHRSCLENIRGKGIVCIQKQLISTLTENFDDVSTVDDGINILNSRFTRRKLLILLDDVDDDSHLNALVGDGSWFLAGSVIIITTRKKTILDKVKASPMYQLNELPSNQSLILFSRHAFLKDSPPSDYEDISRDIVSTTGGLPLALEVIGAYLFSFGRKIEIWKDELKELKNVPDAKVQMILRRSYDELKVKEQQIFLDIACFFIRSSQESPIYMWDACEFYPWKGIEVLSLMSLIKIDENGKLLMHDQLRDFGREIIRLENPNKPQKRSRLWNYEEVVNVLDGNKGTSKIQALRLENYGKRDYKSEQFQELTNLRFLQMNGVNLIGNFKNLLPKLRYLWWKRCPLDFAATDFHPKELLVLDLSGSMFSDDWGGWEVLKIATELKVLNLTFCCSLARTPDLSAYEKLEILILAKCIELKEIHSSLGNIKTLVSLDVRHCVRLKELPVGVGKMTELKKLDLYQSGIKEIPISRGFLTKLETINAAHCPDLAQLPESMDSLVSLTELDLTSCTSLTHIPSSIGHLPSLRRLSLHRCFFLSEIPDSIGQSTSLVELNVRWAGLLKEFRTLKGCLEWTGKMKELGIHTWGELEHAMNSRQE